MRRRRSDGRTGMKSPKISKNIKIFSKLLRASLGSSQVIFPSKTGLLRKHYYKSPERERGRILSGSSSHLE